MASYDVEYRIGVEATRATEQIQQFASAVNRLMSITGKNTNASNLTKNMAKLSDAFSGFMTGGGAIKEKDFKAKCQQIEDFAGSFSRALNSLGAISNPQANIGRVAKSVTSAVNSLNKMTMPNEKAIEGLKNLSLKVLPSLGVAARGFGNYSANGAENMILASKHLRSMTNELGKITASSSTIMRANQTVKSLGTLLTTMQQNRTLFNRYSSVWEVGKGGKAPKTPIEMFASSIRTMANAVNSIGDTAEINKKFETISSMADKIPALMSKMLTLTGMGKDASGKGGVGRPIRSFTSAINAAANSLMKFSDTGLTGQFKVFTELMNKLGALGNGEGFIEVVIQSKDASAKLESLIAQATELRGILNGTTVPKISGQKPNSAPPSTNGGQQNPGNPHTGGENKGGAGPEARSGFRVYGSAGGWFAGSGNRFGNTFMPIGAMRNGAGPTITSPDGSSFVISNGRILGSKNGYMSDWDRVLSAMPQKTANPAAYEGYKKDMRKWSEGARLMQPYLDFYRNAPKTQRDLMMRPLTGWRSHVYLDPNNIVRAQNLMNMMPIPIRPTSSNFTEEQVKAATMANLDLARLSSASKMFDPFKPSPEVTKMLAGVARRGQLKLVAEYEAWLNTMFGQMMPKPNSKGVYINPDTGKRMVSANLFTARENKEAWKYWQEWKDKRFEYLRDRQNIGPGSGPDAGTNVAARNTYNPLAGTIGARRLYQPHVRSTSFTDAFERELAFKKQIKDPTAPRYSHEDLVAANGGLPIRTQSQMDAAAAKLDNKVILNAKKQQLQAAQRIRQKSYQKARRSVWFVPKNQARLDMYESMADPYFADRINLKKADSWRIAPRPLSGGRGTGFIPKNIGYKVLGPSMLDGGGLGIGSMVKGMGVMYGITGLGQLASSTFKDYVDYQNTMQTTMNILSAHDKSADFFDKFSKMANTVRAVGVATKFTAPEVADAAKFLAMAGFGNEDIMKAILPIADIALVGDTDLGSTADLITNIMTAYNIGGGDVRRAADIMTNTFTMSNTTLPEMAQSYKYAAGLLAANGISFQESAGALGVLGNAGVKGSQAGTTMRTILANLRNPTARQAHGWSKVLDKNGKALVGVGEDGKIAYNHILYDENNQRRNLIDVFDILRDNDARMRQNGGQGLDVYKLFHKTAAQGAVALINQVDKWNEIINENFMSDGMVKKLADAKKNTISGLWAQLTSMFTENGIRSFSKLDTAIKNILGGAITALNPGENKSISNIVDKSVSTIVDLLGTVKTMTAGIFSVMTHFGGFVTYFMKFQMYAMPVLMALRGFRSVQNLMYGGIQMTRSMSTYASGIGGLSNHFLSGRVNDKNRRSWWAMGMSLDERRDRRPRYGNHRYTLSDFAWSSIPKMRYSMIYDKYSRRYTSDFGEYRALTKELNASNFKGTTDDWVKKYNRWDELDKRYATQVSRNANGNLVYTPGSYTNRLKNLRQLVMRRRAIVPVASGIGSMAGMTLGGYWGADIATSMGAEEGGLGQIAGSLAGGVVGMGLMSKVGSLIGSGIATGPLGWIALGTGAVAVLGYLAVKYREVKKASDAFFESNAQFYDEVYNKGIFTHAENIDKMNKQYLILNSTQLSLNEKKERYLELLRQERDFGKDDTGAKVGDVAPKLASFLEESKSTIDMWKIAGGSGANLRLSQLTPEQMRLSNIFSISPLQFSGDASTAYSTFVNPFTGETKDNVFVGSPEARAIGNIMYNYGQSWDQGTPFEDVYKNWRKSIYQATSQSELSATLENIKAEANNYWKGIDWTLVSKGKVEDVQGNPRNNPYAVLSLMNVANDIVNNPNGTNLWRKQSDAILKLLPLLGNEKFPENEAMQFFASMQKNPVLSEDGNPVNIYSEKFKLEMGLNGVKWVGQQAKEDAANVVAELMEAISLIYVAYRDPLRKWVERSPFAQMTKFNYMPNDAPARTAALKDENGKSFYYEYIDNEAPKLPFWRLKGGQNAPNGLDNEYQNSEFQYLLRGNRLNEPVDIEDTIPNDFSPSEYWPSATTGYQNWGKPVNIGTIPVNVNFGGAANDGSELAMVIENAIREKLPEIIADALAPDIA